MLAALAPPAGPMNRCPHCGGADFLFGPRGGASQNALCPTCCVEFVIVWIDPPERFAVFQELGRPDRERIEALYGRQLARRADWLP